MVFLIPLVCFFFFKSHLSNFFFPIRFVKGPQPGRNTGFDMDEADLLEMKQCRGVVVASAVFGSASRYILSYFVINRSSRVANFYVFLMKIISLFRCF